ncbi:MAG: hypothetical protein IPI46_10400 [Bacteroidetes bacterium]|nr:hypothetical protein [Bacteroidota bacterium]
MKLKITYTILATFFCLQLQAQETKDASSIEPKTNYEIFLNGKTYLLTEGEVLKLDTTLVNPSISIKSTSSKKFSNPSLSFKYPKHLSFEFEQDFGYKNWTLSGNSLVVLLFEIDAKATMDNLVDEMAKKFGKKNCKIEDFEQSLGRKKCKCKKLRVSLAGINLTMTFFDVSGEDYTSRFIAFQDTMNEDGSSTEEYLQGFKMIDESIVYK